MTNTKKMTIQLIIAAILTLCGLVLLFLGFYAPPLGVIHGSILAAYGEIATFAGALMGIDYTYKFKYYVHDNKKREKDD